MGNTRREIIQDMLSEQPFVSLKELSARFPELSSMTLRRDIEYFESQGECIKVRGGARSMKFITTSLEESFNLRLHANSAAKEAIAEHAAEIAVLCHFLKRGFFSALIIMPNMLAFIFLPKRFLLKKTTTLL